MVIMSTRKQVGEGAIAKERPARTLPPVDYKKMHSGTVRMEETSGKKVRLSDATPSTGRLEAGRNTSAATDDLGHSGAEKNSEIQELDREIEILENSTKKVWSQLKESSLRKEKQQRTERIAKLRKELFIAEKQLEKSEEEGELQSRKLNTSDQVVNKLETFCISTQNGSKAEKPNEVVLSDLRAMNRLNVDVDRDLANLDLLSDSSCSDSEQESDIDYRGAVKSHKSFDMIKSAQKSLKSGLYKKSADSVKFSQIWPHAALQYEYVSEKVSFMSLDIKMLVAGEVEIILSKSTSAAEKFGRLRFLKKVMYFASIYEWKALLS